MSKYPRTATAQGALNKEIEKAVVSKLMDLYPGTQVKVKTLGMKYQKLDPPALEITISINAEVIVIPDYEDLVPDEEESPE